MTQRREPSAWSQAERAIAGLIARLLLHFWTPQELGDDARAAMAEDWVTDLAAFNPEVVSKACGEWRKAQTKRPTIADIRRLCIGEQSSQRAHYAVVDAQADPLAAEEAYARSVGFASALARRDAIAQREERYRKAERWRNSPESDHDPAIAGKREHQPRTSPQYSAEEMKAARKALGMEE